MSFKTNIFDAAWYSTSYHLFHADDELKREEAEYIIVLETLAG